MCFFSIGLGISCKRNKMLVVIGLGILWFISLACFSRKRADGGSPGFVFSLGGHIPWGLPKGPWLNLGYLEGGPLPVVTSCNWDCNSCERVLAPFTHLSGHLNLQGLKFHLYLVGAPLVPKSQRATFWNGRTSRFGWSANLSISITKGNKTRWWFQVLFMFIPIVGNDAIWLISFG